MTLPTHYERMKKKPTDRHSLISSGNTLDKNLLLYYYDEKYIPRNLTKFADIFNNSKRSNVYESIKRLKILGLFEKYHTGSYGLTEKGIRYLSKNKSVGATRRVCRGGGSENLSKHYFKFSMKLTSKPKEIRESLEKLEYNEIKPVSMKNWEQYLVMFDNRTLIVNPNQITFKIHEVISSNTDSGEIEVLFNLVPMIQSLRKIGFIGDGLILTEAHYARVNSELSEFLFKIDNRYYLTLDDGSKFWIDKSTGDLEDETDSKTVRKNIDNFLKDIAMNGGELSNLSEKLEDMQQTIKGLIALELIKNKKSKRKNKYW